MTQRSVVKKRISAFSSADYNRLLYFFRKIEAVVLYHDPDEKRIDVETTNDIISKISDKVSCECGIGITDVT